MKTAIQSILEKIKNLQEKTKKNVGMIDVIKLESLLNEYLSIEKEQIVSGWSDGYQKGMTGVKGTSEEFFKKTFEKNK
jgi:hypothetical protein